MLLSRVPNQSEIVVLLRLSSGQGTTRSRMGQGLDCRGDAPLLRSKFNANIPLGSRIRFYATRITLCLMRTVSLPACKNHTIHCTMFVLALNNVENIPLWENIIVVSFTHIPSLPPPPCLSEDTESWLTGNSNASNVVSNMESKHSGQYGANVGTNIAGASLWLHVVSNVGSFVESKHSAVATVHIFWSSIKIFLIKKKFGIL